MSRDLHLNHNWPMLKLGFAPQLFVKHIENVTSLYRYRDVRFVTLVGGGNMSCNSLFGAYIF